VNLLSLFSGIGGLELGLERAGMTVVGQVEIDPFCRSVLERHWPDVPRHDDVRTAVEWWASEDRPTVDVICGGYPCQPFSLAGAQLGVSDERWMWPAFALVIRAVRPRYVVVENVAALVRDPVAFGWMLGDLAELGFDAEWSVLSACAVGAPHTRERLYLVAYAAGEHGISRDLLGASGERRPPFATRGLSGLAAPARRWAAREWLERQPRVDRLADGIPAQVDRLRVLGNAVVPQVAEHIGGLIMAAEMEAAA
jgi:DNA (cytosine-5)-methyltransferase 1